MSIPLRAAVTTVTATLALTVAASPAHAEARRPNSRHMRPSLPQATAVVLRNLHSRRQEMALRLEMAQAVVRQRRADLMGRYRRQAARAVRFAYAQRGVPYVWGGTGRHGYDCSGLAQRSWRHAGVR